MNLINALRQARLLLFLSTLPALPANAADTPPLGSYNADIRESSISGISSGAFMAVQFATAWSSDIKGVGVIAGGPFYCAQGQAIELTGILRATGPCMKNDPVLTLQPLLEAAEQYAKDGEIDSLDNLRNQKVYLFSGYNDTVVAPAVGGVAKAFYQHYMGSSRAGNLFHQDAIGAGHAQVTMASGGACSANGGDFIDNCGYDQAGVLLQHIYGHLNPRADHARSDRLKPFDQSQFTYPFQPADYSLSNTGYVYVPADCEQHRCRVHVALHGCLQSAEHIGNHYVTEAGYNEWAETNRLIVLYPQTRASEIGPFNPNGCWDWWGYTNSFYATRDPLSRQIGVIKAMLDRVTANAGPADDEPTAKGPVPKDLTASDASATAIALNWSPVAGASAYNIYRSAEGGAFALVGTTTGPSFGDDGLDPATTYSYKVSAIATQLEGPPSDAVTKATRPLPPACDTPGSCPVTL